MHIKDAIYRIAYLCYKIITGLSLGLYLVMAPACGTFSVKYDRQEETKVHTREQIFQTSKAKPLWYCSCVKLMGINQGEDGYMLHDFFRNIDFYQEKLINLYNVKPPGTYMLSISKFINHNIESLQKLDRWGYIPLHWLVQNHNTQKPYGIKILKQLLKKMGDVNQLTPYGSAAIHFAARLGYEKVVESLLNDLRTDPNIKNGYNPTPLHLASEHGHVKVVSLLVKDPRIQLGVKDKKGDTPITLAKTEKIAAILAEAGRKQSNRKRKFEQLETDLIENIESTIK